MNPPAVYRARKILTLEPGRGASDFCVEDGALEVSDGRVKSVMSWKDFQQGGKTSAHQIIDLGEVIISPGLINAHCHLDYHNLRDKVPPGKSFSDWIRAIVKAKTELKDADVVKGIEDGFRALAQSGTTSVFNISSHPKLLPQLQKPPLRTWWFPEAIDLRERYDVRTTIEELQTLLRERPDWLGGFGLSPHSPYTASQELFQGCQDLGRQYNIRCTSHFGESADEHQMFTEAQGPLDAMLREIGRPSVDCGGGVSALENLARKGAISADWIVAHLNTTTPGDLKMLETGQPLHGLTVVHCPLSHRFFGHPPFPLDALRSRGVNLCLGTDSLASNDRLDMFAEMQEFARSFGSGLSPREILDLVTIHPAKAIGLDGQLGQLVPGAFADFIAVPDSGARNETIEVVIHFEGPVRLAVVNGMEN